MLNLNRRIDERIVLHTSDGPIWVTVTRIRGSQVQLGFVAPATVIVSREETDRRYAHLRPKPRPPAPESVVYPAADLPVDEEPVL